jgi:glycosyltransferase involved in cell wall biosynthesis
MYPFTILAVSDLASEAGIEIVMNSYAEFYHSLTPKHKKQIQLIFIDKGGYTISILNWAEKLNIKPITKVLNWKRMEKIEEAYNMADFLLLPSRVKTESSIKQALSRGLPVLSYKGREQEALIDLTCGMLIDYMSVGQSIGDFANLMHILYFDPEACKILKKGALKKYTSLIQWQQSIGKAVRASTAS